MQYASKQSIDDPAINDKSVGHLIACNIEALRQGVELIDGLNERLYTQAQQELSLSGVGIHFRHCIDFYQSFLSGVESGRVNYDRRERDAQVEKEPQSAAARIHIIIEGLGRLNATVDQQGIEVRLEGSSDPLHESDWSRSTIKRELQFLLSHTIHHYALIALALRLQGFEPDAEFGVAPSTLQYWRKIA